jgi:hypothetical protein
LALISGSAIESTFAQLVRFWILLTDFRARTHLGDPASELGQQS